MLMKDRIQWLQALEAQESSPLPKVGLAQFVKTVCDLLMEKLPQVVVRDQQVAASTKDLENFWIQLLVSLSEAKGFGPLSEGAWQRRFTSLVLSAGQKTKPVIVAELQDASLFAFVPEDC
jgi:hypothetical protein